jgi:signal transduction histidine kinase
MDEAVDYEPDSRWLARLSVAACALDRELNVHCPNTAAIELLRIANPDPRFRSFCDQVHPFDRMAIAADLAAAFQEPRSTIVSCRVGTERAWTLIDLHLSESTPAGLRFAVMIPKRFSALSLSQSAVSQAARVAALDDRAEEWRRFAYTVAHDLKVPLVTMESNLRLIQRDIKEGRSQTLEGDLNEIGDAVQKMKRLVVELLDLARIGRLDLFAAAQSLEVEDVDLNEIVDQVAREIVTGNPTWNGSVERIDVLPVVRGRRTQLTEVFQNLIDNAVKYSSGVDSPRVEIGRGLQANGSQIFIRDNGCGVPREDRSRVFDLFVQLRPDASGVGVGLPIVRSIVNSHGGRVWVEDGIGGRGASFCLVINPTS